MPMEQARQPGDGVQSCRHCHGTYDAGDPEAAVLHTRPVDCDCARCRGRPGCYSCGGSFCFCGTHL
jgi:hypothetical protein